jgi:hypothetical protein
LLVAYTDYLPPSLASLAVPILRLSFVMQLLPVFFGEELVQRPDLALIR